MWDSYHKALIVVKWFKKLKNLSWTMGLAGNSAGKNKQERIKSNEP